MVRADDHVDLVALEGARVDRRHAGNLAARLGLAAGESDAARRRIVVLNGEDGEVTGLWVDAVHEVLRVEESELRAPANGDGGAITALAPHGGGFVSLISPEKLVALDAVA